MNQYIFQVTKIKKYSGSEFNVKKIEFYPSFAQFLKHLSKIFYVVYWKISLYNLHRGKVGITLGVVIAVVV